MKIDNNFYARAAQFNNKFYGTEETEEGKPEENFQNILKKCIDDVNEKNIESDETTNAFIKGEDVGIEQVMMKATEASLSLQFLTTTRDKLVEGYKELIKMSV